MVKCLLVHVAVGQATIEYPPPPPLPQCPPPLSTTGPPSGGPVPPGAFLLDDLVLGDKLTIPAGSKLLSAGGKPTARLDFAAARAAALEAGMNAELVFG